MATGIRDKVAVLGMGCSKFGERWESSAEDLMVEAFQEALADAGIEKKEIQAAWFGTHIDEVNVARAGSPGDHAEAALHPRNPHGELLRHRDRGFPRRLLRRGRRGL